MRASKIEVGALNIVASPHPDGIYRKLLKEAANKEVPLWGSDKAKITEPLQLENRPNILHGRILLWAEIDTEGDWLNKAKNDKATREEKKAVAKAIPANLEPNFRSFYYAFVEDKHRLIIECRNDAGQRLAPSRAERMLRRLFDKFLSEDWPDVEITIIPEDESLEKIYAIPRLRRLEIFINRPNPDDATDDADRVLKRLEQEGARSQKLELMKAAKIKTLTPSDKTKKLAEIAATNGYVTGEGKDDSGKPIFESTQKHPKTRFLDSQGTSSFATFLSALRFF